VDKKRLYSHAEAQQILRRAGYSQERIEVLLRDVPDPIDTERDAEALFKHGISAGTLMNRMGGSP
jgi:predicted AAA+ superfamily ATPase